MEVIARMSQYKQGDMLASAVPSAPLHDKSLIRGHSAAYEQYLLLSICHPSPQYTLQPLSSPMSQVFCLCTILVQPLDALCGLLDGTNRLAGILAQQLTMQNAGIDHWE
ncbi:hypothetical protein COCCADRAFT_77 [Bipolaris zeicola 26-R-13]|uniref:Uncharacterized protein n=1 Tax=Cochliobolus carbonum (strain 26-R-13) TaxID=930089 RepID=W6YV10_COCC2|nr:uncharacterized protein COCCADRAFT_77 [Bipolaris zeicola 26-R-13]EUC39324.1 hypothetical protein COCCADRAFT_77 [Bipolaris zeicola 26-R-13]